MPLLEVAIETVRLESTRETVKRATIYVDRDRGKPSYLHYVGSVTYLPNRAGTGFHAEIDMKTRTYAYRTFRQVARDIRATAHKKGTPISVREALQACKAIKLQQGMTYHWSRLWNSDVVPVLAKLGFKGNLEAGFSYRLPNLGAELGNVSYPKSKRSYLAKICFTLAELSVEAVSSKDKKKLYVRVNRLLEKVSPETRASFEKILTCAVRKEPGKKMLESKN